MNASSGRTRRSRRRPHRIVGHEESDVVLGQQGEHGVELFEVASVLDRPFSVQGLPEKP